MGEAWVGEGEGVAGREGEEEGGEEGIGGGSLETNFDCSFITGKDVKSPEPASSLMSTPSNKFSSSSSGDSSSKPSNLLDGLRFISPTILLTFESLGFTV